jgi:hypothetical protein
MKMKAESRSWLKSTTLIGLRQFRDLTVEAN